MSTWLLVSGVLAVLAGGVTIAAATTGSTGLVACQGHGKVLGLVNSAGHCPAGSNQVTLDSRGAQGPTGSTGKQGPAGARGKDGPDGSKGATGPSGAKGDLGTPGPGGVLPGYYDSVDNPAFTPSDSNKILATLPDLPIGTYVANADVSLKEDIPGAAYNLFTVVCTLTSSPAGDNDAGDASLFYFNQASGIPLQLQHTFTTVGSLNVVCNNANHSVFAERVTIEAIPVASAVTGTG